MFCIVKADCDNENLWRQPSHALLRITPRLLDQARSRMQMLEDLRKEDPFFLKAHFCDETSIVAWFDLWNDVQNDELYFEIEGHDYNKEPIKVVSDDFILPESAKVQCDPATMLVYIDEFSFRSMIGNNIVYVVPMFDPEYFQKHFDGPAVRKEAA